MPGPSQPNGKPNTFLKIPWAFPPCEPIETSSPIEDALLGRRRWDHATVLNEVDWLFHPRRTAQEIRERLDVLFKDKVENSGGVSLPLDASFLFSRHGPF